MQWMKNLILFILNPILDDWNNKPSLIRLTYIALMYSVILIVMEQGSIDWSVLVIILFLMIYLCFKGEAPKLISKLLSTVALIVSKSKNITDSSEEPSEKDS